MPPLNDKESALLGKAFGSIVRAHRKALHLTRTGFARRIPLSRQHLIRIESGQAMPTLVTIKNLASALGINAETLMAETDRLFARLLEAQRKQHRS